MSQDETMLDIKIFPLAQRLTLPQQAPARTRDEVPPGYGVQEHCAPFAAAAALGFLVPSPFAFGLCLPHEVPPAGRPFRSPMDRARPDGSYGDQRVFYVVDDSDCGFFGNAFVLQSSPKPSGSRWYEPGISFFDRADQEDLFKVHLPYVWQTPAGIDTVFLPPINRHLGDLMLICGAVETDWYANPVNLVFRKPTSERALHVRKGLPVAQVIFVHRDLRRAGLKIIDQSDQRAETFLAHLGQWREEKRRHRNAYKRLSHRHRASRMARP
jgi:hypothetical protein